MEKKRERKFLQGNDAVALGALYAGCKFYAGYPITPSTDGRTACSMAAKKWWQVYTDGR